MSTQPWLIPDPDYLPRAPIGTEAPIPLVFRVMEIRRPAGRIDEWEYIVEIVNELRDILGDSGRRIYSVTTLELDRYTGVWAGDAVYPYYRIGDEITVTIWFRIDGVMRDMEHENAYVNAVAVVFRDSLAELLAPLAAMAYRVLAKGVDDYLVQIGMLTPPGDAE